MNFAQVDESAATAVLMTGIQIRMNAMWPTHRLATTTPSLLF